MANTFNYTFKSPLNIEVMEVSKKGDRYDKQYRSLQAFDSDGAEGVHVEFYFNRSTSTFKKPGDKINSIEFVRELDSEVGDNVLACVGIYKDRELESYQYRFSGLGKKSAYYCESALFVEREIADIELGATYSITLK